MALLQRFWHDEAGSTAIEYGLIAGMIACFIISALQKVGTNVNAKLKVISSNLT